jgi:opacity protein-like surface antigen
MRKINEGFRFNGLRLRGVAWCALAAVALTLACSSSAVAGPVDTKMAAPAPCVCTDKEWTLELGSGALWSNVRSGQPNQPYTIIPINLEASLKLDDVSLDNVAYGLLRGYSEFYFRGDFDPIVHGPEHWYTGLMAGPRYNFVQPGWKVIPYIQGGVGFGFADSAPQRHGLGEDFNFTFEVGAGAKYMITDDFFARLGVEYQHVSNAGLSEPTNPNHPIDGLGPKLSFGYAF